MRAALAVAFPLLLATLLHDERFAWAALGCFEANVCEDGGTNRSRQQIFGGLIVLGTFGSFLGTITGSLLITGVLVTFCWLFACSMSTQLGRSFAACSTPAIVVYLCALGYPSQSISVALERAVFTGAGVLGAAVLTCFLWQISLYGQLREVIATCYRELFSFLEELSVLSHGGGTSLTVWAEVAQQRTDRIGESLERARQVATAIRLARRRESDVGYQLVYLLETADVALRLTAAFSDNLRQQVERFGHYRRVLPVALWEALTLEQQIANHLMAVRQSGGKWPGEQTLPESKGDEEQYRALQALVDLLKGAARYSQAVALSDRRFSVFPATDMERSDRWSAIRHSMVGRTEEFHSAVRLSTACCLDLLLTLVFSVRHSHWLTLTAVIVLQPGMSVRFRTSFPRFIAAVAGGGLAAIAGATLQSSLAMKAFTSLSTFAALAFPLSPYSLFTLLLMPLSLLLPSDSLSDWGLAGTRGLNTVLGAFVASAAMYLLWPAWEYRPFSDQVSAAIRRIRTYLQTLLDVVQLPGTKPLPSMAPYITEARRSAKLELYELEVALQRLLLARADADVEPLIGLSGSLRQLVRTITTMHSAISVNGNSSDTEVEVDNLKRLLHLLSKLESRVEVRPLPRRWERKHYSRSFHAPFVNEHFVQLERQILQLAHIVLRLKGFWREDQGRDHPPGQTT